MPGLQIDDEMIDVARQTDLGRRLRQGHRACAAEAQQERAAGILVSRVSCADLHLIASGRPGTVGDPGVIDACRTSLEAGGRRAAAGLQSIADGHAMSGRIDDLDQRAADRRARCGRCRHRQHFASRCCELEPVHIGIGGDADGVQRANAEAAVIPLDIAVDCRIARKQRRTRQRVAVVIRRTGQQRVAAGVGLAMGSLDHQIESSAGHRRERDSGLARQQAVVDRLQQRAIAGADFQHRVEQAAIAALGSPYPEHISLVPKQLDTEPVLIIVGQQLAGE